MTKIPFFCNWMICFFGLLFIVFSLLSTRIKRNFIPAGYKRKKKGTVLMSSEAVQPVNKRRRRTEKEGGGEEEVTKNVDTETSATTSKPTTSQIEEKSQVRK